VALQGSLETVGLADVLALLASTAKTGELTVIGRQLDGHLWLEEGEVVGSSVGRAADHAEAVFNLLRMHAGTFRFESGQPTISGAPARIGPLLTEAERLVIEWGQIEASVQSMEAMVHVVPNLSTPDVTVGAEQWRILVAVAGGATIQRVLDKLSISDIDGCRAIQAMVTDGLVTIEQPTSVEAQAAHDALTPVSGLDATWLPASPATPAWAMSPHPAPEPSEQDGDIDVSSDSGLVPDSLVTMAMPAAGSSGTPAASVETDQSRDERLTNIELAQPIQRGALLKFLSSVRT
jgi:hypothetical protein